MNNYERGRATKAEFNNKTKLGLDKDDRTWDNVQEHDSGKQRHISFTQCAPLLPLNASSATAESAEKLLR